MQVNRLANAKWGSGPYRGDSLPEDLYFVELTKKIKLPAGFSVLQPAGQLARSFDTEMSQSASAAAKQLLSLRAQFGNQSVSPPNPKRAPISVVGGEGMDAVAQVYLGTRDARLPWQPSQPDQRTWIADLRDTQTRTTTQTFGGEYWSKSAPPLGTLALRGHTRTEPIDWEIAEYQQAAIELTLKQEALNGALVRVKPPDEPPPVTVLLLVDCSNSMDLVVSGQNEKGEAVEAPLFKFVLMNVHSVLERLQEIHSNGEAKVKVGLMPFGLDPNDADKESLKPVIKQVPNEKHYEPRDIRDLDLTWMNDLERAIDDLEPSADTPLYNAIQLASQKARVGEKMLIYVFTDGVDYIDEDPKNLARKNRGKSKADVRDAVAGNQDIRLSIFHFDKFEQWLLAQKQEFRGRWRTVFNTGKNELEALQRELGDTQFGYYRSGEVGNLMRDSLASIPRPTVRITSVGMSGKRFDSDVQSLGQKILVPQEYLPDTLNVAVQGNGAFESATIEVEALGGEQLFLPYDARGRFMLDAFNSQGIIDLQGQEGGKLSSKLYLRVQNDHRLVNQGELGFEFHFWNGTLADFTRKPRLLVAELSKAGDTSQNAKTFVLADHSFRSATLFPEADVSKVPWPGRRQEAARLRVWAADSLPTSLQQKLVEPLQPPAQLTLGMASVEYAHKGDKVTVDVKYAGQPKPADRVVAICPAFDFAQRRFEEDGTEKYIFDLQPIARDRPVELQFTTVGQLVEAAKAGEVTQFNYERINLALTR
ncbi:MAG: VWA domain-containing protein [Pirellulaceae bacterium]